jgi:hypothetical protein
MATARIVDNRVIALLSGEYEKAMKMEFSVFSVQFLATKHENCLARQFSDVVSRDAEALRSGALSAHPTKRAPRRKASASRQTVFSSITVLQLRLYQPALSRTCLRKKAADTLFPKFFD